MSECDDEADPQTKIRLTNNAFGVRWSAWEVNYFCDDCTAEMLGAEYKKP